MTPNAESPLSQRVLTVIFAVAVGFAIMGFIVGTRPASKLPRSKPERAAKRPAGAAQSYTQLRTARAQRTRTGELSSLVAAVPTAVPTAAPTAAQRTAALKARAQRRSYNGAPPVIPHGIGQRTSASCLTCHRAGAVVSGKIAPQLSHPEYTNCIQCHVVSQGMGPRNVPNVANSFQGTLTSGRGTRVSLGAPPTIPHSTWMRSNCLACHGPAGKPGLRTRHPQRKSCRQCHAPDQRRFPAAGIPQ